jgi:ZIP family zinc transporter
VIEAFFWGLAAGAAFLVGGAVALRDVVTDRLLGLVLGLGAGALVVAITFELAEEAGQLGGGSGFAAVGLAAGAIAAHAAPTRLHRDDAPVGHATAAAAALEVGCEAIVIVGALLVGHGVDVAVIAAVCLCGVPAAMSWTGRLRERGMHDGRILRVWLLLCVWCGAVAAVAHGLLDGAPDQVVALVLAFAGGALLLTVMTELVPVANELAGTDAGLTAVVGFGLAFGLIEVAT